MNSFTSKRRHSTSGWLAQSAIVLSSLIVLLTACGGSGSTKPVAATPTADSTAVQFNMGDAPADWMLSLTIDISSLSLTTPGGATYEVNNGPIPVEMLQRLGTMEPIGLSPVPKQTYAGASVTIASCTFRYLDPDTKKQVQKTLNGPFHATIPFQNNVTIGSTPYLFNFDLDLQHSLTKDGSGAFQFSPQFHRSAEMLQTSSAGGNSHGYGNGMNARYGGMYQMMGIVQSVSSDSFSINALQSAHAFSFKVNQATRFQGRIQQMSQLKNGMGILVTATLQSDGSLLATRVRATMSAAGATGGGIITAVDAIPATALTIVMQNGAGASINSDYLSKPLTVNLTSTTEYQIDTDRVSLTGLPIVPVFNASNIYAGQSVLAFSEESAVTNATCDPTCATITASAVRLREQGFRGTTDVAVTPGATTSFTLTLMPDCAFTTLTGATEITVYQQTETNVEEQSAIAAGATLRVHGLLFRNGEQWILVASTIASA